LTQNDSTVYIPIEFDNLAMTERRTSLLRGTVDLLVLKAVSLEPLHGVGISRRIGQMTRDSVQISYGSLFPALHRMEEKGWLEAEWQMSDNNRRAKYYRITKTGKRQLRTEEKEWEKVVAAISAALGTSPQ
jgi:transcriptional regulator